MTLIVRNINSDYFISNRNEDHPCPICYETPKDDPGKRWVAHENPYSTLCPILTRSLFSQYVHPIHEDCYAQLKESSNNCPECRGLICKEGEVLKDIVYEDDGYWSDTDIAVYEDDEYLSDADSVDDDESGIEAYSVHEDPTIVFVSDEYLSADSVNDDESEIEADSVEEATIVYVDNENHTIYHTLLAIEGLYSLEPM